MATFAYLVSVKRMLGIPAGVTTHDDNIDTLLDVADEIVLGELGLEAATSTTYSERIDINEQGINEVALKYAPILSVTALTIGGTLQTSTDYMLNKSSGILKLNPLYVSFPTGRGIVEITYNAGFSAPIPKELVYAGNLIVCSLFNQQSHMGLKSERAGGYSYTMESGSGSEYPKIAQRILNKHRRIFVLGDRTSP